VLGAPPEPAAPVPLPPGSAGPHAATVNDAATNASFSGCSVLMNHLEWSGDRDVRDREIGPQ
jgi:hypothetical protein